MVLDLLAIGSGFIAGASKFSAVLGAGKGAYDLYKNFTELNVTGKVRESLLKAQKDLPQAKHGSTEEEFLDFWLTRGEMLSPLVKQKLVARFAIALLVIIAAQFGGDAARPLTEHDTIVNLLQVLIQISSGFFVEPRSFLEKEEKKFLANLEGLQTMFYDLYISPTLEAFNKGLENVTGDPIWDKERWRQKWGRISAKFQEAKRKNELFVKGIQDRLNK
jgi:hypothetical protein